MTLPGMIEPADFERPTGDAAVRMPVASSTEATGNASDVPYVEPLPVLQFEQPREFALASLRDGRLQVMEPILTRCLSEAGQFVMEAPEVNEFGFGANPTEALADLQAALAELYFTLASEQERLGPDLASAWTTLFRKVRTADPAHRA